MKTSEIVQAAVKKQAKNLDKVDRIYDSLAKVLVPGSECVAAASIDGILYVAENEVNTDGNKKGVPESLDALKKYILDKFLTKKDKDNRDGLENLAKKICTKEKIKFCFKQNASTYTTNLHTQAENIVFVEKSQTIYYPNLKKNPQIGYNAPMVTFGAVEMMQNVENLKKVKQYCQTNGYEISVSLELPKDHNDVDVRTIYLSNTGEYIVKDQLNENTFHKGKLDMININHQNLINLTISNSDKYNIFQQVSEAGHIYHQMPNDSFSKQIYETMWVYNPLEKKGKKFPNVHAEMKILSKIIEEVGNGKLKNVDIYIGISKDCCFHCHHTLDAANEVLKDYGISIKYRDAHDISFAVARKAAKGEKKISEEKQQDAKNDPSADNWAFPFANFDEDPESIIYKIHVRAKKLFAANEPKKDTEMPSKYGSESVASQDSSFDAELLIQEYEEYISLLQNLEKDLESICKINGSSQTIKKQTEEIKSLLSLNADNPAIFSNCFKDEQDSAEIQREFVAAIKGYMSGLDEQTSKSILLQALQGDYAHVKIKQNCVKLKESEIIEQKEVKSSQFLYEDNSDAEDKYGKKRKREEESMDTTEKKKSKTEATVDTFTTSSPMTFLRTSQERNSDLNTTNAEQTSANAAGQPTQINKPGDM